MRLNLAAPASHWGTIPSTKDQTMATANTPQKTNVDAEALRAAWLDRLQELIGTIESWARELDWSTRRIEKKMENSRLGRYRAPALIMQNETIRLLLEPIGPSAPGVEGVVDLYLMPAYDDIASILFYDGQWNLHYAPPGKSDPSLVVEANPKPLSQDAFREVLAEMISNASGD
jgi:hypothetical protein